MWSSTLFCVLGVLGVTYVTGALAAPDNPSCTKLEREYTSSLPRRAVTSEGVELRVLLAWGSEPARAAATLLLVLLRHVRRYDNLHLTPAPLRLEELVKTYKEPPKTWTDAVVSVSTAWEPSSQPWLESRRSWSPDGGESSGLAGPRLIAFGDSGVPTQRVLHARLIPAAPFAACRRRARWTFYTNTTILELCGFLNFSSTDLPSVSSPSQLPRQHEGSESEMVVYGVGESADLLPELVSRARAAGVRLRPQSVDRATLTHYIRTANLSFLFIDYDFWREEPNVCVVEPPPCISNTSVCQRELDAVIAIRVGDINVLQSYEPDLLQLIYDFDPSNQTLRLLLELELNGTDIEEAACAWALTHQNELNAWNVIARREKFYVKFFYCEDDGDIMKYVDLISIIMSHHESEAIKNNFEIVVQAKPYNCSNPKNLSKKIHELEKYVQFDRLVSIIAAGVVGATEAAAQASRMHVPLLLIDAVAAIPAGRSAEPTNLWRVLGQSRHLALALQRFVQDSGWTRIAVLSQITPLAAELYAKISDGATFAHREYRIPIRPSKQEVVNSLLLLRTKAPIIFVNADCRVASVIMAAAIELEMSFDKGFVWIFREWPNTTVPTTLLTVSFWARGEEGVARESWHQPLLTKLKGLWPSGVWPPRALAIVDAFLMSLAGFSGMLLKKPNARHDLHSVATMRAFYKSLNQKPMKGINRVMQYKEGVVEESYVFVDEWHGDRFSRLAAWRVNASERTVIGPYQRPEHLPHEDGASTCVARAGNDFEPVCYDSMWVAALLLLAISPPALIFYRRALERRLLQAREIQLLECRQHVAALAAYLVEREAIELREELGTGHFGCVRQALLRLPGRGSRYVAAKALRENVSPAEESEFLREACTIASLHHEHIVRLVGVCISNGPPLVLMELAFFGDLLNYLRARRHLAENVERTDQETYAPVEEAAHVSGLELTRLAREAASALAYLGSRGVVHRDVRAANCLVDARRSLKLADFGMARETVVGAEGAPEYACRRRAMFPVLWMAPESLAHGVFSAATDVWALGVLVLELVTLGARPYGSMSPLRVLEYVAAGGCPPLPLDATPKTRALVQLCWQREAERRPSAAEVHSYLTARPRALRAALRIEQRPADADSGIGESPSTELLPKGSPLDSIDA
ncbi:uncharacterized protein LOC113501428 [Trichoplusia ni]|uniref:Uncharacterized protein LOC113501428 n=1 Tax=Trichoplusia ni TaxID=7111 RepID=A0A7E5WCA2_TRINI|nr:uncharacterized protein LOC113501428 [Trichoplusia ni]